MTHGKPCWFELATGDISGAQAFYGKVLGWQPEPNDMNDMEYYLSRAGDDVHDVVAGMMPLTMLPPGTPPNWKTYFETQSADDSAAATRAAGGQVFAEPMDIPAIGRIAVLADPQGAVFGVLQPDYSAMDADTRARIEAGENLGAWNQNKAGHCNWLELMSTDPEAGFDFYSKLFGWTKGDTMDMSQTPDGGEGPGGTYQIFRHNGVDTGGMMGLGDSPVPVWLPYFGVDVPVSQAVETINGAGGKVHMGPVEVPGPAYIAVAQDPQGAWFAVVGATE